MTIIRTDKKLRERSKQDFYETPIGLCRAVFNKVEPENFYPTFVLDPGAGTGNWGLAYKELKKHTYSQLDGVELQPSFEKQDAYDHWATDDFLTWDNPFYNYDLIVGNPPYKQAEEFIYHSLDLLDVGGYLIFLLRLAMLESKKRGRKLWVNTPIKEVWVSMRRIPFYGSGSDDTAYALYVWQKGFEGSPTLHWLDWEV